MTKNFFQRIVTPLGEVSVHVNRRGCKGEWSALDAHHLAKMVEAVQRMELAKAPHDQPAVPAQQGEAKRTDATASEMPRLARRSPFKPLSDRRRRIVLARYWGRSSGLHWRMVRATRGIIHPSLQ